MNTGKKCIRFNNVLFCFHDRCRSIPPRIKNYNAALVSGAALAAGALVYLGW